MSVTVVDKIVGNLIECAHGDGVSTVFMPDVIAPLPTANTEYYKSDWQGIYRIVASQRTNLQIRSQEVDLWSNVTAGTGVIPVKTPNFGVAPDGTTTATRVQCDRGAGNTTGDASYLSSPTVTVTVGQNYRESVWVKTNDGATKTIYFTDSLAGAGSMVVDGTWRRIERTALSVGAASLSVRIGARGTYSDQAMDLLIWGCQVELDSPLAPTPYIPTAAAPVAVTDYSVSAAGVITLATPLAAGQPLYRKLFNEYGIVL